MDQTKKEIRKIIELTTEQQEERIASEGEEEFKKVMKSKGIDTALYMCYQDALLDYFAKIYLPIRYQKMNLSRDRKRELLAKYL